MSQYNQFLSCNLFARFDSGPLRPIARAAGVVSAELARHEQGGPLVQEGTVGLDRADAADLPPGDLQRRAPGLRPGRSPRPGRGRKGLGLLFRG